jgi:hypothetical protein
VIDRTLASRPAAVRLRAAVEARLAVPALVAGLILAAFVARILLDRYVLAPWVMVDELEYATASRSFISGGHYVFRDHPEPLRTIYPALISPAWLAGSAHTAYTLVKVINSGLMAAGAIPLYLWGRRLVAPLWAALAVVLYLAMPGFMYTAEILSENAFVPAMVLALFAIAAAIERPSILVQLLALGAIALAVGARVQGLILLLILPTAIGLALMLDAIATAPGERRRLVLAKLRRFWPSLGAVVLGVLAYLAYEAARGAPLSSGLGIYRQVSTAHYALHPALRWIVYHFGELAFSVGMIPVSALIVLFGLACRRESAPSAAERAFLAVTTAAVFWVVVEIGTFASHFVLRVEERYMFNLAPVLFLALVVWLARGLPRPPGLTAAAVLVPVAFLLALPFESLFAGGFFTDTFALIPLWRLTTRLATNAGDVRVLLGIGALVTGLLFATLARSWARVAVPATVAGFLVVSSGSVFATVTWISTATRHAGGLAGNPSWIDHAVGRNQRVEFLYTTDIDRDQHILWQSEFWNRSVRRVFGVTSQDPSIPDISAPLDLATGRITPGLPAGSPDLNPRYVVAASAVDVAGTRIAQAGFLTLSRVKPPLRLASATQGIYSDGWTGSSAAYTRYVPPAHGARVEVTVSRPGATAAPPTKVTVKIGRVRAAHGSALLGRVWTTRTWTLRGGAGHVFSLPVRAEPFQVQVVVSTTFSASLLNAADTRQLGVVPTFVLR